MNLEYLKEKLERMSKDYLGAKTVPSNGMNVCFLRHEIDKTKEKIELLNFINNN